MFNFFSRARSRRQAIFVPKSVTTKSAKTYALVSSVVDWLNLASDQGCYNADEIATEAPQAYNADYFYAQVCNGGHSQFRNNSRMDRVTLVHALAGLKAAQLTELAACLEALKDEPQMNAADLKKLDDRFFAAYGDYHSKMNAWLLPRVRVIPDENYQKHLKRFLTHDRAREQRFRDRKAFHLQGMMENNQLAGFTQLAYEWGLQFVGIRPGCFSTIFGEQSVIWGIAVRGETGDKMFNGTELGERYLLVPQMPKDPVNTEEELIALFQSGRHITIESVAERCAFARKARLGTIAAILLENAAGVSADEVSAIHLARFGEQPEMCDAVYIQRRNEASPLVMLFAEHRVQLADAKDDVLLIEMSGRNVASALRQFDARHRLH